MNKPIIYGLAVLSVLSTPTLIKEWNSPNYTKAYRTIASIQLPEFVEQLDASDESTIVIYKDKMEQRINDFRDSVHEHKKSKENKEFASLSKEERVKLKSEEKKLQKESALISKSIEESLKKLSSSTATEVVASFSRNFNSLERDLNNAIITNPIEDEKVSLSAKEDTQSTENKENQISTCEQKDVIAELQAQVKELLKDKEEALAKIEEKKKKKQEREEKMKKAQKVYAMGMIFGQGLRASFAMPNTALQFPSSPFFVQSSFAQMQPTISPWFNFMKSYFGGNREIASNMFSSSIDRAPITSELFQRSSRTFIPTFNRSTVQEEAITFK